MTDCQTLDVTLINSILRQYQMFQPTNQAPSFVSPVKQSGNNKKGGNYFNLQSSDGSNKCTSMKQHQLFSTNESLVNNSTRDMSMNIFLGKDYSSGKKNPQLFEDDDTEADASHQVICGACSREIEEPIKCGICYTHSCRKCFLTIQAGSMSQKTLQCPANGCLLEESQIIGPNDRNEESKQQAIDAFKTCPHCQEVLEIQQSTFNIEGLIPEHDCLMNLSKRCSYLEGIIDELSYKFRELKNCVRDQLEQRSQSDIDSQSSRVHSHSGTIRRYELELPQMKQMRFIEDQGEQLSHQLQDLSLLPGQLPPQVLVYREKIQDLPFNTQGLLLRFTLSDLNIRRLYDELMIKQMESNVWVDLSKFFFLPDPLGREAPLIPPIGLSAEVLIPWSLRKSQTLVLQAKINGHETFLPATYQFASISVCGVITD